MKPRLRDDRGEEAKRFHCLWRCSKIETRTRRNRNSELILGVKKKKKDFGMRLFLFTPVYLPEHKEFRVESLFPRVFLRGHLQIKLSNRWGHVELQWSHCSEHQMLFTAWVWSHNQ